MKRISKDPLLAVARIVLAFLIGLLGLTAVLLLFGAVAAPFMQTQIIAEIATEAGQTVPVGLVWGTSALLVAIAGLLAIVVYFMVLLWRIVGTVEDGDPFVPDNAARLSLMGWLALGANVLAVLIGVVARWAIDFAGLEESGQIDTDFGFDGGGVMLILTLFILARVFRKGTQMREELEGTV